MDRTTPILLSAASYTFLGWINYQLTPCPQTLKAKDKEKEYRDFYGQHVSLIHSLIAITFSIWLYYEDGGVRYEADTSQRYLNVLGHSLGYFSYDMVYAEIHGVHDFPMRMHHFSAILGGFVFYLDPHGGSAAIFCILIAEFSNPFMLLRSILKAWGMEKTTAYTIAETAFAVTFVGMRSVGGFLLNLNVWKAPVNVLAKFNVSILFGISMNWCFVILSMFIKKKREQNSSLTGVLYGLSLLTDWLKRHSMFFLCAMVILAVGLPVWAQLYMEVGYRHIKLGKFIVA